MIARCVSGGGFDCSYTPPAPPDIDLLARPPARLDAADPVSADEDALPVYSHSRLSSFENCAKQFHFRYVLRIPAASESIEAFLGKRVHEVLERLYQFVGAGRLPTIERVIARFRATFTEHFDAVRVQITRSELDVDHYLAVGDRCLRNHYRRNYPFDTEETVALEERVTFALDEDGRYRMQGVVDRIARGRDGAIEIHDFKTGARVPSQRSLDQDRQLALYQIGLARRFSPDTPMRLVWHYLQSGVTRTSTRDDAQLETLRARTRELIDRIEAEEKFDPRPNPLCNWCEYRRLCPAFASEHAAAAESPPPAPMLDAPHEDPTPQLGLFAAK